MPYAQLLESGYLTGAALPQNPALISPPMREWERRYA